MLETYQVTNPGQFPSGHTNLENVSKVALPTCLLNTANCLNLLFSYVGREYTFMSLELVTRMPSDVMARPPVAAATTTRTPSNQQTMMTQSTTEPEAEDSLCHQIGKSWPMLPRIVNATFTK
jgi:hypothetical protein